MSILQPLREAISVESLMLDEIELQRRAMMLRSPISGQISQVFCRRGQTVLPGEPILTVAERSPSEIVAYLREHESAEAPLGGRVLIASRGRANRRAESLVIRTSPTIQALPQRLWRDPRVPDYGRAVGVGYSDP